MVGDCMSCEKKVKVYMLKKKIWKLQTATGF